MSPAGHPSVNEARIALEHHLRTEPQPFHCAGPESLDQPVGLFDELGGERDPLGMFQIDRNRRPRAAQQTKTPRHIDTQPARGEPVQADDIGAEIGKQHRRHRAGPMPTNSIIRKPASGPIIGSVNLSGFSLASGLCGLAKDRAERRACPICCQQEKPYLIVVPEITMTSGNAAPFPGRARFSYPVIAKTTRPLITSSAGRELDHFNWALDYFEPMARGNARPRCGWSTRAPARPSFPLRNSANARTASPTPSRDLACAAATAFC